MDRHGKVSTTVGSLWEWVSKGLRVVLHRGKENSAVIYKVISPYKLSLT